MIYAPPPTVAEPLYPERRGAEVRIVGYSRGAVIDPGTMRMSWSSVAAPVIVEFLSDGSRGIADEEELK